VLRLFLLLNLLFLNLYACKGGYESCKLKIKDSKSIQNAQLNLCVKKHQRLLYSEKKPKGKILKHDPYLSLYLVEDKKGFKHPFFINYRLTLGLAGVDTKRAIEGKIKKHQIGLNHFATFSEPLSVPSVLLTSCCSLEGIVTPKGIIEKEYIDRFLQVKKVEYADIGIRVEDKAKKVLVNAINPFIKNNPFKLNDQIVAFDTKKVTNASDLMRWILFSKIGSSHVVKIRRNAKNLNLKVKSQNRYGGGELSDTFLEFLGLSFDKNLYLVKIEPKARKYQLKLGDRLLQINKKNITNESEILKIISQTKESSYLLFERYNFQFFVKVN
jgi:hypothetical protein